MKNEELAEAVATATYEALKEIADRFGVQFSFGGCCSCSETTLDVDVPSRGDETFASAPVFMGSIA